jgi:hypothetical protein
MTPPFFVSCEVAHRCRGHHIVIRVRCPDSINQQCCCCPKNTSKYVAAANQSRSPALSHGNCGGLAGAPTGIRSLATATDCDDSISEDTQLLRGFAVCPVVRLEYICRRSPFRQGYYDRVICCCRAGHKVMNNWPLVANVCIICWNCLVNSYVVAVNRQASGRTQTSSYLPFVFFDRVLVHPADDERRNQQAASAQRTQPAAGRPN